jgi:tetratricopeptide (TPR) repeat protein
MHFVAAIVLTLSAAQAAPGDVDASLRAAVERFYAAQEAEDVPAYLALWSAAAQRPLPTQLKFIFDTGDDKFSDLQIRRVTRAGDRATVRLSIARDRTVIMTRRPDAPPLTMHSVLQSSLTFAHEAGEWKLVREGPAGEALADALVAAGTPAERDALLASDSDLLNAALVTSVARHADAYAIGSQYAAAQRVYELAIELAARVGDKRGEGEGWQNLGNAFYFQRKLSEALAAYEHRLAIERDRKDDAAIASATLGIATVLYSQFEYADALARYREALAIQERLQDTPGTATTLISTGNVQYVQGDFVGALADYRRSRDLFHQAVDTRGEASANEGLGRALTSQGDLAGALTAFALVLQEGQARNDRVLQANALKSSGEIHFRLGNLDVARAQFEQSRSHFEALHDNSNVGRVWQATGLTDLVGTRFAAAEQDYGSSVTACGTGPKPLQDPECTARGIVGLAFAQAAQQHYDIAISSYRRGIAAFVALNKAEDAARAELGLSQALYGSKDYAAALASASHAREQALGLKRDDVLWRALVSEARASRRLSALAPPELRRDRSAAAMGAAKSAVAAVERLASGFEELPVEPVPADSTSAFALLAVLQAENGDSDAAFQTIERRRAHALRIALASNELDIHRGMTEAERDEERRLTVDVTSVAAQIRNETGLPRPDKARIARLEQRLGAAKAARTTARQTLFNRLPGLRVWRGLGGAADAAEFLSTLGSALPLLVEFVVTDDDLLAVVVRENDGKLETRAVLAPVESRVLTQRITQALDPAALRSAEAWRDAGGEIVKLLPAEVWIAIASAPRVLIAPDDVLWHVPFEALPFEEGVLGDRTVVRYISSATALLPANDPATRGGTDPLPLLAVASPELTASARDRMSATAPDWSLPLDTASEGEARAVAAALGSPADAVIAGGAATEAVFRERAPAAAIIHVAAPFRVNSASPLFSPLLLGGDASASAPDRDGTLEARELFDLELHARAAVFTDGAALSMRAAAPALDTVRWAWRAAGVSSIAVPRWRGDPTATPMFLEDFYKQLKEGAAVDDALQHARATVRRKEEMRAPFYWAGWMVIGTPERTEKTVRLR